MQMNQTHPHVSSIAPVPSRFPWFFSLVLAGLVLAGTIGMGVYGFFLDRSIVEREKDIAMVDTQIQTASADRKIILAQILATNTIRPSIDVAGLVKEFQSAAATANVRLKGFSVVNDTISTTLIATEGDPMIHPDPASTIIKMMREYALGQKYFELEPIASLTGDAKSRSTSVQFKVV